ncbi:MAG: capsular biosynthesis protein [Beijerinckiaceae bacterium]|nr:capsular biosynthesis protein [Beijerinckiaceae bacterium]
MRATGLASADIPPEPTKKRVYLLLQGPASPFMRHVADNLLERGHEVHHVSFCLGDWIFWGLRATNWFFGRPSEWPAHVADLIRANRITDLLMLGDGRPVHAEAIEAAIPLGCRIHILEHGYIRPDWLTIEPDGMSGFSRFPREPALIQQQSRALPAPDLRPLYRSSFLVYAMYDLIYHLPNVALGWLVHPHYRRHGPVHPIVEYSGWIWKAIKSRWEARHRRHVLGSFMSSDRPFFLFPLQLPGDYQIKVHAPGGDLLRLVNAVIASFAQHAPMDARLLFKVHPIDNGLSRWHSRIGEAAALSGAADRIAVVDGGSLDAMISASAGVVTINSTVGTAALMIGKPLIALGNAIFALPGLTHQGPLAGFWTEPSSPDPELVDAFMKVLVDRIQVRGGFIASESVRDGAAAVAGRITEAEERLPIADRRCRKVVMFRYREELFGEPSTSAVKRS